MQYKILKGDEMSSIYYDGTKLLNTLDLDKMKPEIFMACGNRSSGKTTFFNKMLVDNFLNYGNQFCLLYRFTYEITDCHNTFFGDINGLFFPDHVMTSESKARGVYRELYLDNQLCGFAVAMNCADQIKRCSHLFHNVQCILMDEFQSETNKYCEDEITKFISIHRSIARGAGKQNRYVPVYMISNCVSLLNPYFAAFDVCNRLRPETKILKGHGWVVEQSYNEAAFNAQKQSRFLTAFEGRKEILYMTENLYLNDNNMFIERPPKSSKYVATVKHKNNMFNVSFDKTTNNFYCADGCDSSYPVTLAADLESHNVNTQYAPHSVLIQSLRSAFHSGNFRFKNLKSKQAVMSLLHY